MSYLEIAIAIAILMLPLFLIIIDEVFFGVESKKEKNSSELNVENTEDTFGSDMSLLGYDEYEDLTDPFGDFLFFNF